MPASSVPVGIDLGTTFSVVAYLDSTGRPCTIPNSEGDLITPSVVLFDGASTVVGKEAVKAAPLEPERVADFAKRDMGSAVYARKIGGDSLPPEVIQSMILEKLKRDAEMKLGPVTEAVVTVPAFFNEPRRKATQDAAQLAGLKTLDIINEPTAAAIAFGYQVGFLNTAGAAPQQETILVYDLGGGTFDVTVMQIAGTDFTAIATSGDVYLGGIDWDRRVADHVAEKFKHKYRGIDPREDAAGLHRLLREAEDTKRALSARDQATVSFEHVGNGLRVPITRAEFEEMTADLLDRTRFTVRSVLKEARLEWKNLTRLLLVGGSSRMPMVQQMLERESGLKADRSLSPDEAVAHGAALYAGFLKARSNTAKPAMRVRNVSSHDLGVLSKDTATGRSMNAVIIPRNTVLPATRGKRFKTMKAGQQSIAINVIEGGDSSGKNATAIGKCVIRDLPPELPAGTAVEVFFTYAENGRLTVKGRLPDLEREALLAIERASGLSDAKLQEWDKRLKTSRGVTK
jgi:molecular chaperone DnaK